jgi:hypothetical protein
MGLELADLRHQVARIGHQAGPGGIDRNAVKLRIGLDQVLAQHRGEPVRLAGARGDAPAPEQPAAAVDEPVIVAGAAVVADRGPGAQAGRDAHRRGFCDQV